MGVLRTDRQQRLYDLLREMRGIKRVPVDDKGYAANYQFFTFTFNMTIEKSEGHTLIQ